MRRVQLVEILEDRDDARAVAERMRDVQSDESSVVDEDDFDLGGGIKIWFPFFI